MNNEEIRKEFQKVWKEIGKLKDFDEKLEKLRSYFIKDTTMYQGKKIHEVINKIFGLK